MIIRESKGAFFYGCSTWPECNYTFNYIENQLRLTSKYR